MAPWQDQSQTCLWFWIQMVRLKSSNYQQAKLRWKLWVLNLSHLRPRKAKTSLSIIWTKNTKVKLRWKVDKKWLMKPLTTIVMSSLTRLSVRKARWQHLLCLLNKSHSSQNQRRRKYKFLRKTHSTKFDRWQKVERTFSQLQMRNGRAHT